MGIYKTITKTFMLQFHEKTITHACKLVLQLRLIDVRLSLLFFKRESSSINRNRFGLNLKVKCGTGLCSCLFMTLSCGTGAWGSEQCLRQGWSPFSFTWPLPDQSTRTTCQVVFYICFIVLKWIFVFNLQFLITHDKKGVYNIIYSFIHLGTPCTVLSIWIGIIQVVMVLCITIGSGRNCPFSTI